LIGGVSQERAGVWFTFSLSRFLTNLIHDFGPEDSGTTGARDRMIPRAAWRRDEKPEYYGHCHLAALSRFGLCAWQNCWPSGPVVCKIAVPPHCGQA
jgi:hypothetical protein